MKSPPRPRIKLLEVSNKPKVNAPCPCGSGKKYKRCCGSPVSSPVTVAPKVAITPTAEKFVIAYTDETGNSGTELFDGNQPYFWTGSLISEHDMQTVAARLHAECLAVVEKEELHGNELGLGRIEKIAGKLRAFFAETECKLLFTFIEKAHLAATTFADTVLDSGNNMAIAPVQYGIKGLRLPLAWDIVQIMGDEDRRAFWAAFEGADAPAFTGLLDVLHARVRELNRLGVLFDRNTQLLTDAFAWGMQHPQALLQGGMHPLDSPKQF